MRTLGATLLRDGSPALPDAPLVAGRKGAKGSGGNESFRRDMSGRSTLSRSAFRRSRLGPSMTPAPAACDILGLEDCIKATTFRDEPATERAARLLINAKSVPGSRLDAFVFLAGRESLWRTADSGADSLRSRSPVRGRGRSEAAAGHVAAFVRPGQAAGRGVPPQGGGVARRSSIRIGRLFSPCVAHAGPLRVPGVPFSPFIPTLPGASSPPAPMSITLSRPFVPR